MIVIDPPEDLLELMSLNRVPEDHLQRGSTRPTVWGCGHGILQMRFDIITIFPEFFRSILEHGLLKRAIEGGHVSIRLHNLRDFTDDAHRTVDDRPFGGGPGMVFKPEPLFRAVESLQGEAPEYCPGWRCLRRRAACSTSKLRKISATSLNCADLRPLRRRG